MILALGNRGRREKGEKGGSEGVDGRHDVHGTEGKGRGEEEKETWRGEGRRVRMTRELMMLNLSVIFVGRVSLSSRFIPHSYQY